MVKASGSFTVTASQAGDSTYAVAPDVTESLNVGKLSQTIAFSPITDKSIGDFDFDPGATAGSGLPVTYTSSAPLIASVEGTTGQSENKVRICWYGYDNCITGWRFRVRPCPGCKSNIYWLVTIICSQIHFTD